MERYFTKFATDAAYQADASNLPNPNVSLIEAHGGIRCKKGITTVAAPVITFDYNYTPEGVYYDDENGEWVIPEEVLYSGYNPENANLGIGGCWMIIDCSTLDASIYYGPASGITSGEVIGVTVPGGYWNNMSDRTEYRYPVYIEDTQYGGGTYSPVPYSSYVAYAVKNGVRSDLTFYLGESYGQETPEDEWNRMMEEMNNNYEEPPYEEPYEEPYDEGGEP